ncbi:MAG: hypothetical protein KGZ60_02225 [Truepera sp.]|nr:hypothetical protein [Truepera sp.]
MIVSKTPLRIPLAGGLTDIKPYAERFGGVTVSATIDKYLYVLVKENLGGYYRLRYQDVQEKVHNVEHIKHELIREAVKLTGLTGSPLDIVVMADLAGESGLGTSGALAVGLLHAMHAYQGRGVSQEQLYREAAHLEVEVLGGASGYHDPAICALGGFKLIEYQGAQISARDVAMAPAARRAFEESLLLFYSGRHHKSKPSLELLTSHLDVGLEVLHAIKRLAYELEAALMAGDLAQAAWCIGEMQRLKQQLPGHFEDDYVRDVVARVRRAGAYAQLPGGKISAFVIACCPERQQAAVIDALADLKPVQFRLEAAGSRVFTL